MKTKLLESKTGKLSAIVFTLWIIAQIITIISTWGNPQFSDAAIYRRLAEECAAQGTLYPTAEQFYSENFIFNPGYVNFLILIINIFGTLDILPIINLLLNISLCVSLYIIVKTIFNHRVAEIAVLMFCCLPSNILNVSLCMSDLLFLSLTYVSIVLSGTRKWGIMIVAGLIMAYANYIRPITILFIVPLVIYFILKKYSWKCYIAYFAGIMCMITLIMQVNYTNNGHYVHSSSTAGYNLIIGANDEANGTFNGSVFEQGKSGYIEFPDSYSTFQKDSIWRSRAIEWIKDNPERYISLMPTKFVRLWVGDDYSSLCTQPKIDYTNSQSPAKDKRIAQILIRSIIYYIIILLSICGLIILRRKLWGIYGLFIIPVLGVSAMHMLMYGGMRYHYPFLPLLIIYAAYALCWLLNRMRWRSTVSC